jgi:hypothetical protein
MAEIVGADFLSNPRMSGGGDVSLPELSTVDCGSGGVLDFGAGGGAAPAPALFPSMADAGIPQTKEGLNNLNADFFNPAPASSVPKMSDELLMKRKYEILRKFDRLRKLGCPMRKTFTLDSPIDEMELELNYIKKEKEMDRSIKQYCDWYISGMSGLEWSSKNLDMMKAFGLQLDGLSESAQMNVSDLEEDFEELYELYGDKLKFHPLIRIPIHICKTVYMVHITNQMVQKAPIPNMSEILKTNPEIARQLASAAMQQQTATNNAGAATTRAAAVRSDLGASAAGASAMAGLNQYLSGMVPPPPQQTHAPRQIPTQVKSAIKLPTQARPAAVMAAPPNIDDLLRSVGAGASAGAKTVSVSANANAGAGANNGFTAPKKGGSTGKNSVTIKL